MITITPQYIKDGKGKKTMVILPVKGFGKLMEDLEDICLYDEAKQSNEPSIPIDDAFKMIEAKRKAK